MCAHSADVDAELWPHNLCLGWGRPEARPSIPARSCARGFGLIPVSVSEASVQVGRGVGQRK